MDNEEQNGVPGCSPEFGAIFMSNNATRKECLRRKVFALPSSLSRFVKQVKAGMILFLFEFERRELHGVFQACSDGAMNILPHVFSSSGKKFPAQVKFTPIWYCRPLSENEFRDVIRENYFSRYKFNFGLSEKQVRRLLSLFSLKRLEDQATQRQLTRSKVARPHGYSTSKNRRLVDRSPMSNQIPGECDLDNTQGPVFSTMHQGGSFYNDDRATDGDRFGTLLEDQVPQRQLTRSKVARPHGYSTSKNRRLVDRSPMSNQILGECDMNNTQGPVFSTMHQGDSFYNDDRATDDDRFGTLLDVGYERKASAFLNECFHDLIGKVGGNIDAAECATSGRVDTKWDTGIELQPAVSIGYSSGNSESIFNDVRFAKSDRVETECYKDDGSMPAISTVYPSSFQSNVSPHACSNKNYLETDSFAYDPTSPSSRASTFLPSMETRNSNVAYPMNSEDSIVTTTLLNDSGVPNINYRGSSSLGFGQSHAPLQECVTHDSFVDNVLGSARKESYPSLLETGRACVTPDVNSGSRDFIPLPYSNQHERLKRTSLLRHEYSDNLAVEYSKNECIGDLSLLKPSLAPVPSSEIGNAEWTGEPSSSYRTSPSKIPSLTFSIRYPALLRGKHDCQAPEHENEAEFGNVGCQHHGNSFFNNYRAFEDGRFAMYKNLEYETKESQHQLHVHEPIKVDYHEVSSWSPAACQNPECLYPDHQQKRTSVFSRLALPPKACEQESSTPPAAADTSVNEVMDMLHRSRYHWVKTRFKQFVKHQNNAAKFRDKKQATRNEGLTMISKEMNVKPISFSKDNSSQKTGETTFVDFKRRSAVRKSLEDGKTGNNCETQNNKSASSAAQSKRRKLVRPDFCENKSSDRCISGDALENGIAYSTECSVGKNAESSKVSAFHVNQNDMLQNVKLPDVICQTAVEGNNIDKGSGSNSEQFSMESFVALGRSDGGRKELSESQGILSTTLVSSGDMCIENEPDLITRDVRMDGLQQDHNDVSHSPKICEDNDGSEVGKSKLFYNAEQIKDLCPVDGEISVSNVN
ncbi:hypothetical protein DITRI_Ditri19aG0070800 [Diplodiscus trichospermus]